MSGARTRLLRFFVVGLIGFALQLVVLVLLTRAAVPYVLAAVIAVEVTIVHNFLWHEQWTWRDRSTTTMRERWRRLARFNGASALTSIAGNALGTFAFVELGHLPVAMANTLAVVLVSALNFALADRWAFTRSRPQRDGTGAAESTGSGWPVATMSDTLTR
jgi:dolichol-phosphate mannosyltransferase